MTKEDLEKDGFRIIGAGTVIKEAQRKEKTIFTLRKGQSRGDKLNGSGRTVYVTWSFDGVNYVQPFAFRPSHVDYHSILKKSGDDL